MNRLRLTLVLAALALLALWHTPVAHATTTCTATMSGWNATVATSGYTDAEATLTYNCNTTTGISWRDRATVKMCLAIGQGSVPSSTVSNRLLANSFNENLRFQIYRDSARTQVLGESAANPSFLEFTVEYALQSGFLGFGASGSTNGTLPVYARIPSQTGLAAGSYTSTFANINLRYRYRDLAYSQTDPVSCDTAGVAGTPVSFSAVASATVPNACTIQGASDLDFGSILATETGTIERTSAIDFTCTRRTAWQVGLDNGDYYAAGTRRMAGPGGAFINYGLYRSATWEPWGNTPNVDRITGTGTGASQRVTVYGRIVNQYLTQAGSYSDTIRVIVTY